MGCTSNLSDAIASDAELRVALETLLPSGLSVESATLRLEREGFTCQHMRAVGVDDAPPEADYEFLRCSKASGPRQLQRAWVVEVKHTRGLIDSILTASVQPIP